MTDVKKLVVAGVVIGGSYWAYMTFKGLEHSIIIGNPKFIGFTNDGKIKLTIPVSNISAIPAPFGGFNGYIEVKGARLAEVIIANQSTIIKANTSISFNIEVIPNYFAVLSLGADVIKLLKAGKLKDVHASLKGKSFSLGIGIDVNVPIV